MCWAVAQYIRLVWYTGRWRVVGAETATARFERGQPLIIATWHGRLLMTPFGWRHSDRSHVLISAHRDGRLISRTLSHFKAQTITGSTHRGGADALRRLRKVLREGGAVGITPDGPRGPRMRVSPGIVQLARLTGVPIFPLAYSARPCHIFDSWDRFILPFPFSKGLYLWDDPISISRHADKAEMESVRRRLEERLNALTQRADAELGHTPIEPAPIPAAAKELPAS
jgi:lysophospholipid acyltransferase (LPLAT)-like uncharacterized protein